jgi:hypothetical protein
VRERVGRFLRANALTSQRDAQAAVYSSQSGAVVLPDTGTGYRSPNDQPREAVSLDSCGITVIARPIVAVLAEMFRAPCGDRPHVSVLIGPAGSGRTTIVGELARTARQQGFVPIASPLVGPRYAEVCRGRSLFIIHRGTANGFSPFLRAMTMTPQPHVLLLAGEDEVRGVDTVAVGRIDPDVLMAALRPGVEQMDVQAIRAVRRAARHSRGLPGRFVQRLWPGPVIDREAARHSGPSRAAERASVYGWHGVANGDREAPDVASVASTWPAPGNSRPFAGVSKRRASSWQQAAMRLAFDTFDRLSAGWLVGRVGPTPPMARFRWPASFFTGVERGTRNRCSTRRRAMACVPAAIAC